MAVLESILAQIGLSMVKALFTSLFQSDEPISNAGRGATLDGISGFLSNRIDDDYTKEEISIEMNKFILQIKRRFNEILQNKTNITDDEKEATLYAIELSIKGTTSQTIIDSNFEPIALSAYFKSTFLNASRDLNESAKLLYEQLIHESATFLTSFARKLPDFEFEVLKNVFLNGQKLLKSINNIFLDIKTINRIALRDSQYDQGFTLKYLTEISIKLNQMDHLGIANLSDHIKFSPLDVAYIQIYCRVRVDAIQKSKNSLINDSKNGNFESALDDTQKSERLVSASQTYYELEDVQIQDLVQMGKHILILGEAGSGKTTLLKWLAVQISRNKFRVGDSNSEVLIPFYIRLREYANRDLPAPENFLEKDFKNLNGEIPIHWVHRHLRQQIGGIILIDGFDELPQSQRESAKIWLRDIMQSFPNSHIIITSRPNAAKDGWLREDDFIQAMVKPLEKYITIAPFIRAWHKALKQKISDPEKHIELDFLCEKLIPRVQNNPTLLYLADTPLLLSAICAINRDRNEVLPETRVEVYRILLEMLLSSRDKERGIRNIIIEDIENKVFIGTTDIEKILRKLAYWMMTENHSVINKELVLKKMEELISGILNVSPRQFLDFLLDRSGVLRSPTSETIDFIHLTLQEFLAADEAVISQSKQIMISKSDDDRFERMIYFAGAIAGAKNENFQLELVKGLRKKNKPLLALECVRGNLGKNTEKEIQHCLKEVISTMMQDEMKQISAVGRLALPYLGFETERGGWHLGRRIHALANIGDEEAYEVLKTYINCQQKGVIDALLDVAPSFGQKRIIQDFLLPLSIDSLNVYWSSYEGLNQLTSLRNLEVVGHFVEGDENFLESLTQLQSLTIDSRSEPQDLHSLSNLTQLQSLNLWSTSEEQDISFLNNLTQLRSLSIDYLGEMQDLKFLEKFTELQSLDIGIISPNYDLILLKKFKKLRSLTLYDIPKTQDLTFLQNLKQLKSLVLYSEMKNLNFLGDLTQLQSLSLYFMNETPDLNFLKNLPQLRSLTIGGGIKSGDLVFFDNLTQLQSLTLSLISDVQNLPFLENLTRLQSLTLTNMPELQDLNSIKNLTKLQSLNLQNMPKIQDLGFLENLSQLHNLFVSDINKENLKLLCNLKQVKFISISSSDTNLDYKMLSQLPSLENLNVRDLSELPF